MDVTASGSPRGARESDLSTRPDCSHRYLSRIARMVVAAGRRPEILAALGFFGSVLILFGSFGVGWLGRDSKFLSTALFATLRVDLTIQNLCAILVVLGGATLVVAWLLLGPIVRGRPEGVRTVIQVAIVWALPLLATVPLFSRDVFAYVGQGRLRLNGYSPYSDAIATVSGWNNLGVDQMWVNSPTPYGPIFVWIEELIVNLVGVDSPDAAIAVFRAIAVVSVVATGYFAWRLARQRNLDEATVLWVVSASPLVLFNFVVAAHNDALMLALLLAGIYFASTRRYVLGVLFVTASIAIKPAALLALPIIGLLWAGTDTRWKTRAKYWAISFGISAGILGVIGLALDVRFDWIFALSTPGAVLHWFTPAGSVANASSQIAASLGWDPGFVIGLDKTVFLVIAVAVIAYLMTTRLPIQPLTRLTLAFATLLFSSPIIYPWYAFWVLALWAILGIRWGLQTRIVAILTICFAFGCLIEVENLPPLPRDATLVDFARFSASAIAALLCIGILAIYARRWLRPNPRSLSRPTATCPDSGPVATPPAGLYDEGASRAE